MISLIEAITPRGNQKIQFSLSRKTNAQAKQVTKSGLPDGAQKVRTLDLVTKKNIPRPKNFKSWGTKKFTTRRK